MSVTKGTANVKRHLLSSHSIDVKESKKTNDAITDVIELKILKYCCNLMIYFSKVSELFSDERTKISRHDISLIIK